MGFCPEPTQEDSAWGGGRSRGESTLFPLPAPHPALGIHTDHKAANPGCFEAAGARLSCQGFVHTPPLWLAAWELGSDHRASAAFEVPGRGYRKRSVAHPGPGPTPPQALSPCPLGSEALATCSPPWLPGVPGVWRLEWGAGRKGLPGDWLPSLWGPTSAPVLPRLSGGGSGARTWSLSLS